MVNDPFIFLKQLNWCCGVSSCNCATHKPFHEEHEFSRGICGTNNPFWIQASSKAPELLCLRIKEQNTTAVSCKNQVFCTNTKEETIWEHMDVGGCLWDPTADEQTEKFFFFFASVESEFKGGLFENWALVDLSHESLIWRLLAFHLCAVFYCLNAASVFQNIDDDMLYLSELTICTFEKCLFLFKASICPLSTKTRCLFYLWFVIKMLKITVLCFEISKHKNIFSCVLLYVISFVFLL